MGIHMLDYNKSNIRNVKEDEQKKKRKKKEKKKEKKERKRKVNFMKYILLTGSLKMIFFEKKTDV